MFDGVSHSSTIAYTDLVTCAWRVFGKVLWRALVQHVPVECDGSFPGNEEMVEQFSVMTSMGGRHSVAFRQPGRGKRRVSDIQILRQSGNIHLLSSLSLSLSLSLSPIVLLLVAADRLCVFRLWWKNRRLMRRTHIVYKRINLSRLSLLPSQVFHPSLNLSRPSFPSFWASSHQIPDLHPLPPPTLSSQGSDSSYVYITDKTLMLHYIGHTFVANACKLK